MTKTDEPELVDVPMPNGAGVLRVPAEFAEEVKFIDLPNSKPTNVIAALARVALELPGIGKDSKAAPEQGAYAYRGIEAITAEAQHLLGKYGVVFVLHEIGFSTEPLTVNNKPWTDTYLICEYDIYGPGGPDDKITVGPIHTVGRDNSDKGPNKCRTQAFKYALLQTLCIGDAKDDADQGSPEADRRRDEAPPDPEQEARLAVRARISALTPEQRDRVRAIADEEGIPRVTGAWTDEQLEAMIEVIDGLEQETTEQAEPHATDPESLYDATPAPEASDSAPHIPQDAPEPSAAVDTPPEPQEATQAPVAVTWDAASLPTERTAKADLRWVAQAPAHLVAREGEKVKALSIEAVDAALVAQDLPTTGNEATRGQRLAMRSIRLAMEALGEPAQGELVPDGTA